MHSDAIVVRHGSPEDADTIAAFNRAMARETEGRELAPGSIEAGVRGMFAHPRYGFYAVAQASAEAPRPLAGCLMVTFEWSDWRNGVFWWIQSVYVDAPFRRRGVYRRLYRWVHEQALQAADDASGRGPRCCGFRLYVEKDNHAAQRTYHALGMSATGYLMFEQLLERGG